MPPKVILYRKANNKQGKKTGKFSFRKKPLIDQAKQPINVVADKQIVKLRYVDSSRVFGGVGGAPVRNTWKVNSLFDPDFAVGGHQPLGFDQWATFYTKYRVFRCDYKVTVNSNISGSNPIGCVKIIQPEAITAFTTISQALEQTRSKVQVVQTGVKGVMYKGTIHMPKVSGLTPAQYKANENTSALMTADPVDLVYLQNLFQCVDQVSNADVTVITELVYHAELFDRTQLAQS